MRLALVTVLLAAALGSACNRPDSKMERATMAAPAAALAPQGKRAGAAGEASDASVHRHIAMRHELHLQTEADAVEPAWRRAHEACLAAGCEVLESSVSRDGTRRPAQAQLEARVPPEKLEALLKTISALGSVGQHSQTAEDKTDEVLDIEARLKNMTEFRDNLRRLMSTPGAKLKDVIEVERELVRVQSELDSLASRRKALASLTEKVRVNLRITAKPAVLEDGVWSPVSEAVTGAGRLLAQSLGGLISFVVASLPWVLLLSGVIWALRALWRRRRRAS